MKTPRLKKIKLKTNAQSSTAGLLRHLLAKEKMEKPPLSAGRGGKHYSMGSQYQRW